MKLQSNKGMLFQWCDFLVNGIALNMIYDVINGDKWGQQFIDFIYVVLDRGYSTNYGLILNKQCYNSIV